MIAPYIKIDLEDYKDLAKENYQVFDREDKDSENLLPEIKEEKKFDS